MHIFFTQYIFVLHFFFPETNGIGQMFQGGSLGALDPIFSLSLDIGPSVDKKWRRVEQKYAVKLLCKILLYKIGGKIPM